MAFPTAAAPSPRPQDGPSDFLHPSRAEGELGRLRSELASEATKKAQAEAQAEILKQRQAKSAKELAEELYSSLHSNASSQPRPPASARQSRRPSAVESRSTRKTGVPSARKSTRSHRSAKLSRTPYAPSTLAACDLQSQVIESTVDSESDRERRTRSRAQS